MKRRKINLNLPAIRRYREAIENGKLVTYLIESGEKVNAGSVILKYAYKNRPWVVTIEAKRIYDNKHEK